MADGGAWRMHQEGPRILQQGLGLAPGLGQGSVPGSVPGPVPNRVWISLIAAILRTGGLMPPAKLML
ncbi:uncharacterized protein V6R79_012918 [Siganus canaliculatus]